MNGLQDQLLHGDPAPVTTIARIEGTKRIHSSVDIDAARDLLATYTTCAYGAENVDGMFDSREDYQAFYRLTRHVLIRVQELRTPRTPLFAAIKRQARL